MKSFLALLLVVATATLCFSQSMTVHTTTGPTSFNLADIDSITFTVGTIPTDSLVAYYPFNGNANDESGHNHHGTVIGASLTTNRFADPNSAYRFSGTVDKIDIGMFPNIADVSVSIWFTKSSLSGYPSHDESDLFGSDNYPAGPRKYFKLGFYSVIQDHIFFPIATSATDLYSKSTVSAINDSSWHHLVVTRSDTSLSIYIDGTLQPAPVFFAQGNASGLITTGVPFYIGSALEGANDVRYYGKIDDVRVYNRVLSESDVLLLYHEGGW